MSKPATTFFGKVFNRKATPDDDRKVLSLDKSEKREDGTWKNIKATRIIYEDGTEVQLGDHLVMKFFEGEGNHIGNLYYNVFDGPRDTGKDYEDRNGAPPADDFKDDDVPF
jgi:hypothetical protein